jgi:hypothetical protein
MYKDRADNWACTRVGWYLILVFTVMFSDDFL